MNELLTIAGTVAAIQMLFAGCREWRSACRIVAVRGVDADDYARFGCIPLQFAGTRFRIVRAAVAASGFFWVRPATRKNAYAARRVRGVRDGDEIDYRDIRPGDLLHLELDDGEHLRQFDRSMRRGVASFYRTIAVWDLQCPGENLNAHCITVRAQGSLVGSADDEGSTWLEFKVISAAPRSNLRSGHSALSEIPEDAIELLIFPADTYERVRCDMVLRHQGRLHQWLLRRHLRHPAPQIWTGATARSMSAGRRINATDARSTLAHLWQQHSHGLLPIRR